MRSLAVAVWLVANLAPPAPARRATAASLPRLGGRPATRDVGLKIFVPSGSVRIVGWDRDSIVVYGRVASTDRFYFLGGRDSSSYKLGAEPRRPDGTSGRAELVINVPRKAELSIKTVDASIAADGVGGWFYSVSGGIRLSGSAAHVDVESIRGDVDLDVTSMLVKARTGRGRMTVRGAPEDVDATTVEGDLVVEAPAILRGRFGSVTGDIRYAAAPAQGSVFDFSDHAGAVEMRLPRSASSTLDLSSIEGSIQNGFASVRPVSGSGRTLIVRLGTGDAHVTVRTFKGAIRLLPQ